MENKWSFSAYMLRNALFIHKQLNLNVYAVHMLRTRVYIYISMHEDASIRCLYIVELGSTVCGHVYSI